MLLQPFYIYFLQQKIKYQVFGILLSNQIGFL